MPHLTHNEEIARGWVLIIKELRERANGFNTNSDIEKAIDYFLQCQLFMPEAYKSLVSLHSSHIGEWLMGEIGEEGRKVSECCDVSMTYGDTTQEYRCLKCGKKCKGKILISPERSRLRSLAQRLIDNK